MRTMSESQTVRVTITHLECPSCGIPIAITPLQEEGYRAYGKTFYCVLGHTLSFSDTGVKKLQKELSAAQDCTTQAQTARDDAYALLEVEQKKRKRLEKRVSNGVCPHCHRTFQNLQRHVKGKHPTA